jgi:predicted nucleic acid-binding protein
MIGILPDTSVWIDFFNLEKETVQSKQLRALMNADYRLYTCPPVYQEILQGISLNAVKEYGVTKRRLAKLRHGRAGVYQACEKAIEIYRTLRTKGVTIRKPNDCLIAAYCILNNLALLHHDRDFDPIEKHYGLQVVH